MKKFIKYFAVTLILPIALVFAGCGKNESNAESNANNTDTNVNVVTYVENKFIGEWKNGIWSLVFNADFTGAEKFTIGGGSVDGSAEEFTYSISGNKVIIGADNNSIVIAGEYTFEIVNETIKLTPANGIVKTFTRVAE